MVIVDLETFPIDDAGQYITPDVVVAPDLDTITAAKNLRDPEKIAADIAMRKVAALVDYETAKQKADADYQQKIDRCALDADLCRIVALGYAYHDTERVEVATAMSADDERMVLDNFWRNTKGHNYVTFGGLRFDLPVLQRRSLYLNVPYPALNLDRYRTPHKDLLSMLTYQGVLTMHGLKFYCARFGIQIDDVTSGKDIAGMVKAGDWASVEAHCRADVKATKQLAQRLGVFQYAQEAVGF